MGGWFATCRSYSVRGRYPMQRMMLFLELMNVKGSKYHQAQVSQYNVGIVDSSHVHQLANPTPVDRYSPQRS